MDRDLQDKPIFRTCKQSDSVWKIKHYQTAHLYNYHACLHVKTTAKPKKLEGLSQLSMSSCVTNLLLKIIQ